MADGAALNRDLDVRVASNHDVHLLVPESIAARVAQADAASDTMIRPDPIIGTTGTTSPSSTSVAPPSPTEAQEVSYINGFTAAGLVTANSYWGWADAAPTSFKDGSPVLGTGATVTFSFDPTSNWTATEKQTMLDAMAQWESVANVNFVEDDNPADVNSTDLLFHRGNDGGAYTTTNQTQGVGSTPGSPTGQVMISIDTSVPGFDMLGSFDTVGGYGRSTIIHELGHFLGLGHGGPYNGNVTPSTDQYSAYDTREWSIMSYIYWAQTSAKYYSQYPVQANWGTTVDGYNRQAPHSLMPLDILAIQQLYGASQDTPLSGGQVYGFNSNIQGAANGGSIASTFDFNINKSPVVTLYNEGTGNTLDLSGYLMAQRVDLHGGAFSDVGGLINNVGIAYGTKIDTAIGGGGNDSLTANDDGDTLVGGAGADTLIGGAGSDTASYQTAAAGVTANLADHTLNTGDAAGDTYTSIENLTGSAFADTLTGDSGDNIIEGGAGGDTLTGGGGNDTLSYAHSGSGVGVYLNDGSSSDGDGDGDGDQFSGFSNVLGSAQNDVIYGDSDANVLNGGAGNDILSASGAGDTLIGGAGADILLGQSGTNTTASYATATVGITVYLASSLYNTGDAAGDLFVGGIQNLTGSAFDDVLIGDTNANVLTGGAGDDLLRGGGGGDSFVGGDGSDTVSYAWSNSGVIANLANSSANALDAAGDSYSGIENVTGTSVNDTLTGDSGDNVLDGGAGGDLFFGGGGNDTVTYADSSSGVGVFLYDNNAYDGDAQGDSLIGISNLIGSAFDDFLISNAQGDGVLDGGAGNDKLYSETQSGTVTLIGGAGADTMADYAPGGTVIASYSTASSGVVADLTDAGQNTGDAAGDSYIGIEDLAGSAFSDSLTGDVNANALSGAAGDDLLTGLAGDDTLDGGDGSDTLDGGAGADALIGGAGNNVATYQDATAGLTVNLGNIAANTGDAAGDTYSNVENVEGSAFNDTLTGDAGANILDGAAGDDTFIATGGGDTFIGGDGNDTVSYANAASGVTAALDFSGLGGVATGDMYHDVENLVGSSFDDLLESSVNGGGRLIGGAGTDELFADGNGDVLIGGAGGDYFINDYPDTDLVTVSYSNSTQGLVINLDDGSRNTGDATNDAFYDAVAGQNYSNPGTVGFAILGSAYHDYITGDAGDNVLNGYGGDDTLIGGAGADTMTGGIGNDTYYVDDAGDNVVETSASGGNDIVYSSVSYDLHGRYVETLSLRGTGNIDATGNGQANTLIGNGGKNVLDGMAGNDTLTGGAGADTFVFDTALSGTTNVDTITDFTIGQDLIQLDLSVFKKAGVAGGLGAGAFTIGSAATTTAQRIIYDAGTGDLFYDADGSGSGAQVQFATLAKNLALTAGSFTLHG